MCLTQLPSYPPAGKGKPGRACSIAVGRRPAGSGKPGANNIAVGQRPAGCGKPGASRIVDPLIVDHKEDQEYWHQNNMKESAEQPGRITNTGRMNLRRILNIEHDAGGHVHKNAPFADLVVHCIVSHSFGSQQIN